MNNYQSIATINSPEFINLQPLDINPMMSKCEIKVLYLGKNRNGTSINKQAAIEMSKTLRGAPIVGYYRQDTEDFFDHGDQVIMDGEGIHFNTLTKPYGFVAPDAQVWFQEFEEFNENGESTVRTYLMTTGYLWTGQFEEAQQLFNEGGKPQSMELDENSLHGFWSKDEDSELEFFIINDAIFSKLCILGDDVEPCFEGASISAPNISKNFTLDDDYKKTLFEMMKELQYTLQGGNTKVADVNKVETVEESTSKTPVVENTVVAESEGQEVKTEEVEATEAEEKVEETAPQAEEVETETEETEVETETTEGESADAGESSDGDSSSTYEKKEDEENKTEDKEEDNKESDDDEDKKEDKYALLETQYTELQASYAALQEKYEATYAELDSYKNEAKDDLISEFSMLSEEDKKDVIKHKSEYSLEEIKSKLAVLCYDKKVDYTSTKEDGMTINIVSMDTDIPDWIQAVDRHIEQSN